MPAKQEVQEFVRLGAYIEHSMCMYHPESTFHFWNFDRLKRWIELVGPERTLLGSDLGQKNNPLPVEGLRYTVEKLLDIGIKEHADRTHDPKKLGSTAGPGRSR